MGSDPKGGFQASQGPMQKLDLADCQKDLSRPKGSITANQKGCEWPLETLF